MDNLKRSTKRLVKKVRKNSPAILLVGGILGFAGTAFLAYKAAPKMEKIVEDIEEKNATNEPIDKVQVGKDLAKALTPTIGLGVLSAVAVIWSYKIQTNRLITVSGVLAATQATHQALENKIREKLGQKAYEDFLTTDEVHYSSEDEDGNTVDNVEDIRSEVNSSLMEWFSKSSESAKDGTEGAHTYNLELIRSMTERAQTRQFNNCGLLLNELRDIFGWDRLKAMGALTGWSDWDTLNIEAIPWEEVDENGVIRKDILVKWTQPKYIYDTLDYGTQER